MLYSLNIGLTLYESKRLSVMWEGHRRRMEKHWCQGSLSPPLSAQNISVLIPNLLSTSCMDKALESSGLLPGRQSGDHLCLSSRPLSSTLCHLLMEALLTITHCFFQRGRIYKHIQPCWNPLLLVFGHQPGYSLPSSCGLIF